MTVMEPRVAERRKTVSEDRARRRLKWILVVIGLVILAVAGFWLVRSPVLSIRTVEIAGSTNSNPAAAIDTLAMGIGTPTIDVDGSEIAKVVGADPWVKSVSVDVSWPGTITIDVLEYQGVAPVQSNNQWLLVSPEGAVLAAAAQPGVEDAQIVIELGQLTPGDTIDDPVLLGALVFVAEMSGSSGGAVRVFQDGSGLRAEVAGHGVRLGRPVDMAEKAFALVALLDAGIEEGASIDLIAPLRPAVANPKPEVEGEE